MAANDIARVYARSLVDVGKEKGILNQLDEEMKFLSELIEQDNLLKSFLSSPSISKKSKLSFVKKVFSDHLSNYTVNLLNVLIENGRQSVVPDIYEYLGILINEINNRQRVTLITSEKLDDTIKEKIKNELTSKLKKEILIDEVINKDILGGLVIKIGDKVINGSLSKDLQNIKKTLLNSKVRRELAYED